MIEDYAFKEAVALAFRGYSREIGNDEVLLHDLRAKAIHSFGANPAELLPNSNHSSPVQEMLEKALGKLEPTELIKAIKEMRAGKSKAWFNPIFEVTWSDWAAVLYFVGDLGCK